jgi:hypothetical protein
MINNNPNNATGPRTDAGKQTSSRNAIKHGCCSTETLILPSEKIEDFQALEATWFQAYSPKNDLETHLLNQVIQADWLLQRSNRALAKIETKLYGYDVDPMQWNDNEHHALQRFTRYQTARRNEFNKAKKALDDHRKMQAAEVRSEEKHVIYKEKNKPKLGFLEEIQAARAKAIELGILKPTDGPNIHPSNR